jgi:hypothetical protein
MMREEKLNLNNFNDRELIVSLLNEYANRLEVKSSKLIELRQKYDIVLYLNSFGCLLLFLASISLLKMDEFLALIVTLISLLLNFFIFLKPTGQKIHIIKREITIIAMKLERVIRATSQAEEYVESNFARRIELDLRLAEAEEAIENSKNLVENSPKNIYSIFTA